MARERVCDSVVRQIEQLILEGALKPGDRLPAEREAGHLLIGPPERTRRSLSGEASERSGARSAERPQARQRQDLPLVRKISPLA